MKKKLLSVLLLSTFTVNAQFWTEKATGFTNADRTLYSISIVDANVIWASEYDSVTLDYTIKGFTRSTDKGETWTSGTINLSVAIPDDLGISTITAVSTTTAWVSVYPIKSSTSAGGIWKTTDSGITWTKQTTAQFNSLTESYANFVHFWDANNGIAMGDPQAGEFEIYTTTDGGTNWIRVDGASIPDPDAGGEYGYENLYTVSGNTIWFGTDIGRIFKSTDKGLTWTATQSLSTDFIEDKFTFSNETKGLLMIKDTQKLHNTTDGGATWNPVAIADFYKSEITYIPGTSIVVAAEAKNPFSSSYSTDDGVSWTVIDNGIYHGTLAFLNNTFGFSAGKNTNSTTGGISKFNGIPPLKTQNFDTEKQIYAYPNPTNGILHLDSEFSQIKETKLFDLLGKQVYDSKFQSLNKVNLDLSSLQSGLYLLKISTDSGKIDTMKIMKN